MKKKVTLSLITLLLSNSFASENCIEVAKGLNPFKGLIAKVKSIDTLIVKDNNGQIGKKYTWNYQFEGRPTYTTWVFFKSSEGNLAKYIYDGDIFLFEPVKGVLEDEYVSKGIKGYQPIILSGIECLHLRINSPIDERDLQWGFSLKKQLNKAVFFYFKGCCILN